MALNGSMTLDATDFLKNLQRIQASIPKVTSRAMQLASEKARDDARASAEKNLHNPRPQTLKAIRNNWPNRDQVKAGRAIAKVFVMPFLVEEIHPNVFGGVETDIPKGGSVIVSPTRKFKTNEAGNIPSLRYGKALKRRREQTDKFVEVPLERKPARLKHLPAGMYKITGGRGKRKLVMIFSYRRARITTNPKWSEYPRVTRQSFISHYPTIYNRVLARELAKAIR